MASSSDGEIIVEKIIVTYYRCQKMILEMTAIL